MAINWQDPEVRNRVLAAVIASFNAPINCTEVARLFGPEATYNAIESALRGPKKLAVQLRANAPDTVSESPRRRAATKKAGAGKDADRSAPTTPKKAGDAVQSGRVSKTPAKKRSPAKTSVKSEYIADNDEFVQTLHADVAKGEATVKGEEASVGDHSDDSAVA